MNRSILGKWWIKKYEDMDIQRLRLELSGKHKTYIE